MSDKKQALTVYDATYNLLRKLGLTTVFGNPGSTEQPFLKELPAGLRTCTRSAGGDRRSYGRRLCSSYCGSAATDLSCGWERLTRTDLRVCKGTGR
jgi:hypothetical protein